MATVLIDNVRKIYRRDAEEIVTFGHSSWGATLSNMTLTSGSLYVTTPGTAASYTSAAVDAGAVDQYEVRLVLLARIENHGLTVGTAFMSWESPEAGRRSWHAGVREWFPSSGIEWGENPAWDELDAATRALDSM